MTTNIKDFRTTLNEEFFQHANINGVVSVLYYPGQNEKSCFYTGHSELVVEGISYSISCNAQFPCFLDRKIAKARNGKLPFQQIHIAVTPKQLARIKVLLNSTTPLAPEQRQTMNQIGEYLETRCGQRGKAGMFAALQPNPHAFGLTCMNGVSHALSRTVDFHIPSFINLSPLPSSVYLRIKKKFGDGRIHKIESHGNAFASARNIFTISKCVVGELLTIAFPIALTAYFTFR